ncbi:MAG: FAD-binding oxidoreductase [Candidatus Scalindua sp.]
MSQDKINHAVKEWIAVLGRENVIDDKKKLELAGQATFATSTELSVIIRPMTVEQIQQCVRIANRFRVAIYPVSCGMNWGYGSACTPGRTPVLMQLHRCNQICGYNEKFSYVRIEPGVTFRQLNDFLVSKKSKMFLNCPGNSADSSIVGLTLERGLVPGPHANRSQYASQFEVVLPDGNILHTGLDRFGNLATSSLFGQGLGPGIDSLFMQSNLGIVTRMTVEIQPLPEYFQYFSFTMADKNALLEVIEKFRELKIQGVLGESCAFFNDYRLASFVRRYPFKKTKGKTPLPEAQLKEIRDELEGGQWYVEAAIEAYCEKDGLLKRKFVEKKLGNWADSVFWDKANSVSSFNNREMQSGLNSIYWRKTDDCIGSNDPHQDKCGVIWCVPVVPFEAEELSVCIELIYRILREYGYEPGITIRCISNRVLYVMPGIIYDRENHDEDQNAMDCYHHLLQDMSEKGFIPYRLGIQSMNSEFPYKDKSGTFFKTLKKALDPENILAPGRYEFWD